MKKISYISIFLFTLFAFSGIVHAACPLGPDVTKDLYGVLKVIRIAAPLLVIAFTIFESIQAVTKGDAAADLKKVATRFGKRCIYAVLLFFLPIIIDQVMQMANVWGPKGSCDIENAESNETENGTSNNNQSGTGNNNNGNNSTNNGQTGNGQTGNNSNNPGNNASGYSCSNFIDNASCIASGCDWYGGACYAKQSSSSSSSKSCSDYSWSSCPVAPAKAENGDSCERAGGIVSKGYCKKATTSSSTSNQTEKKACTNYTNPNDGCPSQAENGDFCQETGSKTTGTWKCIKKTSSQSSSGGNNNSNNSSTSGQTNKKNCSQYVGSCPPTDDYGNTCKQNGVKCTIESIGGKKNCSDYPATKNDCPPKDEHGNTCVFSNGKCTLSLTSR